MPSSSAWTASASTSRRKSGRRLGPGLRRRPAGRGRGASRSRTCRRCRRTSPSSRRSIHGIIVSDPDVRMLKHYSSRCGFVRTAGQALSQLCLAVEYGVQDNRGSRCSRSSGHNPFRAAHPEVPIEAIAVAATRFRPPRRRSDGTLPGTRQPCCSFRRNAGGERSWAIPMRTATAKLVHEQFERRERADALAPDRAGLR